MEHSAGKTPPAVLFLVARARGSAVASRKLLFHLKQPVSPQLLAPFSRSALIYAECATIADVVQKNFAQRCDTVQGSASRGERKARADLLCLCFSSGGELQLEDADQSGTDVSLCRSSHISSDLKI